MQAKPGFEFGIAVPAHRNGTWQTANLNYCTISGFPQGFDFVDGNKVAAVHADKISLVEALFRFGD